MKIKVNFQLGPYTKMSKNKPVESGKEENCIPKSYVLGHLNIMQAADENENKGYTQTAYLKPQC